MNSSHPQLTLLTNGRYGVAFTDAGAGVSTWNGLDVTRWREDATRDCWGQFVYVRGHGDGRAWSAGWQPLGGVPDAYKASLDAHRAEIHRRDGDIETTLAVCVSPDHDAEVRIVTLANRGKSACELDVTSYAEVCLNHRRADAAHPAFAKLFLETLFADNALFARRRPRAADQHPVFAVHLCAGDGPLEYETDRARFLGRTRTAANPAALAHELSGTTGPVLDPCFALRRRVKLAGGATAKVAFVTGAANTRDEVRALAAAFRDPAACDRAFDRAGARTADELRQLGLSEADAALFHKLAAHVLYTGPALRDAAAMATNTLGQPGLWPHAISGDRPLVLVKVATDADADLAVRLAHWHGYVRSRGLDLDLVVLDGRPGDPLRGQLAGPRLGQPGGVFLLDAAKVPPADRTLLAAAARVVLGGATLADALDRPAAGADLPRALKPSRRVQHEEPATTYRPGLHFFNGLGGFTKDGREYVVFTNGNTAVTPAPWSNVMANPDFGCFVTESGGGYSWAGNSQMNRLTPWSNDPVSDPPGEVVYLRDEATGEFWSATPLPCGAGTVEVRHGQGYTSFVRHDHGLDVDATYTVPTDAPVKLVYLRVRNMSTEPRTLSATFYAEWVLGGLRDNAALTVVCERDAASGAILARSAWAGDFAGKLAFVAAAGASDVTSDRTEFLGRLGSPAAPAAMTRVGLSNRVVAGTDPCAAVRVELAMPPAGDGEVVFVLGQADDVAGVRALVAKYAQPAAARAALDGVKAQWDRILGAVAVKTPSQAMDVVVNRWLVTQALVCRLWGRSAFYQSGGAYGFRDQLQDSMALVYGAPAAARAQILLSAARQFPEGDVQHWWHPPAGRGVRTRITDDLFFLPYVVCHYVATTGDASVLEERVPFLSAPVLRPDQEEVYDLPGVSEETATVYEHCLCVLDHAERVGPHGIPLMGTGDWNDGMNKVGAHGKGESIWNGWFIIRVLKDFAELAGSRNDERVARQCGERAEAIRAALEKHAWDGRWYRRAYFDDGTPLGSSTNDECQIDALPQAWSVISGAGDPDRSAKAMAALDERLVNAEGQLIHLFVPPFDDGPLQPGYIKGYVPGIRENGGQYTHGVTWAILATALQGRGDRAVELWEMLNPVNHARTAAEVATYKVEPYVVCADVYGAPPHVGRGGWTWYTGAAGWMYRVALEAILGFRLRGDTLTFEPCVAKSWPGYDITYRYKSATYKIAVDNSAGVGRGVKSLAVDGAAIADGVVRLADDGRTHEVRVVLG